MKHGICQVLENITRDTPKLVWQRTNTSATSAFFFFFGTPWLNMWTKMVWMFCVLCLFIAFFSFFSKFHFLPLKICCQEDLITVVSVTSCISLTVYWPHIWEYHGICWRHSSCSYTKHDTIQLLFTMTISAYIKCQITKPASKLLLNAEELWNYIPFTWEFSPPTPKPPTKKKKEKKKK